MGSQLSNTVVEGEDNTKTIGSTAPDQLLEIESLEKILNYKFKDKRLLVQAFTDASYVDDKCDSYEILELLGDSILNMSIIDEFIKLYPKESPGPLTKLRAVNVDTEKLARVAVKHQLYRYLRHKKPLLEEQILEFVEAMEKYPLHSNGLLKVPKVLADIVESTIGALFRDCNSTETVWEDKFVGCGQHPVKKETARNFAAKNAIDNFSKFFGDL
ncbi:ribonuclease III family protein [Arabidopsis lyrata subsp. lyrata]|uniref:Ribonuclease III family protein n=1 Tax=Arabidopsis lyrata subsp. lyrata TaxID=81972 RepID=D7MAI2_ARALL|nr:ribonuclease III family protein [Arabidopsis lyrata subsp. lyrata]